MKKLIFIFLLPLGIWAQVTVTSILVNPRDFNDVNLLHLEDNTYDILTKGKDPYIFTLPLTSNLNEINAVFSFDYFCSTGVDFIQLYFYPLKGEHDSKIVGDEGSTEG